MFASRMQIVAELLASGLLLCKPCQSDQPSAPAMQQSIKVVGHCSVDMDRTDGSQPECMVMLDGDGTEQLGYPDAKGTDFRVEEKENRILFRPLHGAMLAPVHELGRAVCEAAQYSKHSLRIDKMPPGSLICIRTSEKRYGQIAIKNVVGPPTNEVELSYVIW